MLDLADYLPSRSIWMIGYLLFGLLGLFVTLDLVRDFWYWLRRRDWREDLSPGSARDEATTDSPGYALHRPDSELRFRFFRPIKARWPVVWNPGSPRTGGERENVMSRRSSRP